MGELTRDKIIIPLSKCLPGMVLLQPVVEERTGAVLLPQGSRLTEESIQRGHLFQHTQVWVGINMEEKIWQVDEKVLKWYKDYATTLKHIIWEGNKSEDIDVNELKRLARCIISKFTSEFDLLACVNLVNQLDKDCYRHSINVALLSIVIGRWKEYSDEKLEKLVLAGLLHDVGKIDAASTFANSDIDIDLKARLAYKRHPILGYEKLVRFNELDNEVLKAVLTHHERSDGSGFPLGLTEDKLSDMAKIIGLADTYDELRQKQNIFDVIKELRSTQVRTFDIELLLEFCTNIMNYYIGSRVLLSTGEVAEIEAIQPQALYRPIVKTSEKSIDLYAQNQIDIVKVF